MATQAVWAGEQTSYIRPERAATRPSGVPDLPASRPFAGSHVVRVVGRLLISLPRVAWVTMDALLLAIWIHVGYRWFVEAALLPDLHVGYWTATGVFVVSLVIAGLIFGLYERETLLGRSRILTRMMLTSGLACVLAYAFIYVVLYTALSRRLTVCSIGAYFVCGVAIRTLACWAVHKVQNALLIVGNHEVFQSFQQSFREGFLSDYRLVGFINAFDDVPRDGNDEGRLSGRPSDLPLLCRRYDVDDIVISTRAARSPDVMHWILPCLRMGCRVTNEEVYYEKAAGRILVERITPNWFLFADFQSHCQARAALKRLFDILVAVVAFFVSLPLWLVIAVGIKVARDGPVFYSQDRVGQNGKVFRLYKFRTMVVGAENGQCVWASPDDPRATRLGRILRKARLDELPQLYNILIGDMSVVGPRPERPSIVLELAKILPYYEVRHLVKPGLTGWAQIGYKYGSSIEDARRKLQFDIYYLKHMSVELDVVILFRTLGTFLRGGC